MIWIRSLCERFGLIASTSETSEPHWPLFSRHLPLATTSPLAAVHLLIILSWPEAPNAGAAPHRARSCGVAPAGVCARNGCRQPPRPAIPQFLRDPHIRIERSRYVKDLARRLFTSAALGLHLSANW